MLGVCSYDGFAERMERAGLCGELIAVDCRWPQLEVWFERNFWQFDGAWKDTTFVSTSPFSWKSQNKPFLNVWHDVVAQWELRGGDKAKGAIKKARSIQCPGTRLLVFLVGSPDKALQAVKEHLSEFEGRVVVTAAHGDGSTIVPWLRVAPCPREVTEPPAEPEPEPVPEPIVEEPAVESGPEVEEVEPEEEPEDTPLEVTAISFPEEELDDVPLETETESAPSFPEDSFPAEEWAWLVDGT